MLQVQNLSKSFGTQPLFDEVTFSVMQHEIIGLVGKNGSGKTTLLKIILGQEGYDDGNINIPKGYKLGYLDQHIHFTKETVIEEACSALPEDEKYDHYKAEKFLAGLGFEKEDMDRHPSEFSGGFQLRINLTKSLLKNPNLLLLDEPTNYLDIVSLRWLRRFLQSFRGEVILTTHDRDFMDSVTTHTMGFRRGRLKKVKGSTEKYYQQILADEEIHEKTRINQDKKIRELQQFVDRFRAKASKATQAQSKLKMIEKMKPLAELRAEQTLGFRFHYKQMPGKTLMKAEGISFSYTGKEEDLLFKELSFQIRAGDCLAVVGKNGKGKTTLLNVLAQTVPPSSGEIGFHPETAMGYYQQTNKKNLNPQHTVIDEISRANDNLTIGEVRSICGAMMFSGDDAKKKISVLSGGEQGRVLLGQILAHPTNLLLLDEPSNHLDMDSVQTLLEEIRTFKGGVVIVTHNEEMLRELANKLIIFRKGGAELFLGGYNEFLAKIGWDEESDAPSPKQKTDRKEEKRTRAERVNERSRKLRPLKQELAEIEQKIVDLETSMEENNERVSELIQQGGDGLEIKEIYKTLGSIQLEIANSYEKMEELLKRIENLSTKWD